MKRVTINLAILTFVLLLTPVLVSADTVLRVSERVTLAVDQKVEGDFYGLSTDAPMSLSGSILGDAHVIGGSITTNGTIGEDLFAVGGLAQVHASVTDDVRIIAGETTLAEEVGGDVFVLGGVLTVLSSAHIHGDIFFYGGKAEINGQVDGSVYGVADAIRVDGSVLGDVDVRVGSGLVVGDRGNIEGNVTYESATELRRAQNAVIVGEVVHNSPRNAVPEPRDAVIPFLIYAFTTLVMYALLRNHLSSFAEKSLAQLTQNGLIGIAGILVLPFAVLLAFVTIIGAVIGLLGLLSLLLLYMLSAILSSVLLGVLVEQLIVKKRQVTLLWTMIGIVAYSILWLIPFIGPLATLILMAVTMGTLLRALSQKLF